MKNRRIRHQPLNLTVDHWSRLTGGMSNDLEKKKDPPVVSSLTLLELDFKLCIEFSIESRIEFWRG